MSDVARQALTSARRRNNKAARSAHTDPDKAIGFYGITAKAPRRI